LKRLFLRGRKTFGKLAHFRIENEKLPMRNPQNLMGCGFQKFSFPVFFPKGIFLPQK
jgi:hypothetical protein